MDEKHEKTNTAPRGLEEILHERGKVTWATQGRSMSPLLKTKRDVVEITRIDLVRPDGKLKKNDVALYRISNLASPYILHRVHEVHDGFYIIIGDNNVFKEKIPCHRVLGVMTGLTRNGRNVNLDGTIYRAYVALWGGHFKRRIIFKKIKNTLKAPLRAIRNRLIKRRNVR